MMTKLSIDKAVNQCDNYLFEERYVFITASFEWLFDVTYNLTQCPTEIESQRSGTSEADWVENPEELEFHDNRATVTDTTLFFLLLDWYVTDGWVGGMGGGGMGGWGRGPMFEY